MKYTVVFTYMDGGKYELQVHPDDMESLMNTLGKSEVYFNSARGVGVWLSIDKIRYFEVEKVDGQGRRIMESHGGISDYNARAESREGEPEPSGDGSVAGSVPALESQPELVEANV